MTHDESRSPDLSDHHVMPLGSDAVDTVLQLLNEASPANGFEQRLLQRLEAESRQPTSADHAVTVARRPWAWVMSGALTACALGVVLAIGLVRGHSALSGAILSATTPIQRGLGAHTIDKPDASQQASSNAAALAGATTLASHAVAKPRTVPARLLPTHTSRPVASACPTDHSQRSQPSASFPAPQMPLTEQERLLIAVAHRNDPVQVALLDPAARNANLQRERAADETFFARPALPPDVQREINAALRSQYVNTPPPAALTSITN